MSFLGGPKKPLPPPSTPTRADASVVMAGEHGFRPYESLVSTGSVSGLRRKAETKKTSLIGGA